MSSRQKTSVVNVQINENNEIEYIEARSNEEDNADDDDDIDDDEGEEIDGDSVLVVNGNGVMTIKMKNKTLVEHVCAKCSKSYDSLQALKKHLNFCRHLPISQIGEFAGKNDDHLKNCIQVDAGKAKTKCFCCLENIITAHNGHIMCNFCPKSFKSHLSLERHLYTLHSASTEFPCTNCNATCPTQEILDLHVEHQHNATTKPFTCKNCGKEFTRKYHLERHLQFTGCDKSLPKVQLPCKVCGKIFTRTDNLREHLRCHMGKPTRRKDYKCNFCAKAFFGSSLLNIHLRTHTGERPFPCDLCDKAFPSNGALRKHRRMHTGERPYGCSVCQKYFSAKETLNRHMKIHTGDRPHTCEYCSKSFIQATQLKAHMFHHTGENIFPCAYCPKSFSRRCRLEAHITNKHKDRKDLNVEQKNTENENGKKERRGKLKTEVASEKNVKVKVQKINRDENVIEKFRCNGCELHFLTKSSLNYHKKRHEKEELTCRICNKKFEGYQKLTDHLMDNHSETLSVSNKEQKKTKRKSSQGQTSPNNLPKRQTRRNKKDEISEKKLKEEPIQDADIEIDAYKIIKIEEEIKSKTPERVISPVGYMSDSDLERSVGQLLNALVDDDVLRQFGWPKASVEYVLDSVIEQCGQPPIGMDSCPDMGTKLRENTKLLFTTVVDNSAVKEMLNNSTVDEVILHVLKLTN